MANVNAPFGFRPVGDLSAAPYNGKVNIYTVPASDSTAIYIGDPVVDVGTSTLNADGTYTKDVAKAATTDVITGVVVGVMPDLSATGAGANSTIYRAASTLRKLLVVDDPNALFEMQEISTGTALTGDDIGLNVSFAAGTPSTATGRSGAVINNATEATTNTLALKIVGASPRPGNVVGDGATVFIVRINRHRYVDQLAGV